MKNQLKSYRWGLACFLLVLLSAACERRVYVRLVEAETPTFECEIPSALTGIYILRIPNEYIGKDAIPGEALGAERIVWAIHGERKNTRVPITYGRVPEGMVEDHPAKPLGEGGFYLIECSQNENGGCNGAAFIIKNGKAVRP